MLSALPSVRNSCFYIHYKSNKCRGSQTSVSFTFVIYNVTNSAGMRGEGGESSNINLTCMAYNAGNFTEMLFLLVKGEIGIL